MKQSKYIFLVPVIILVIIGLIFITSGDSEDIPSNGAQVINSTDSGIQKTKEQGLVETGSERKGGTQRSGAQGSSEKAGRGDVTGGEKGDFTAGKSSKSTAFMVDTKLISEYNSDSVIEKVGTISSNEIINVTSQVSGKLDYISVKEGETVVKGEVIAHIEDLYSKYYLDLDKAQIDYEKAIISKESNILSLDKKISDSKISLDDSIFNYENALKNSVEEKKEAELDFKNSDLINTDSESYLELERTKLDYDNTVNKNIQQINTYTSNVGKEYSNLLLSLTDVIEFSDKLLGVTNDNKDYNDDFEDYLGAKDSQSKSEAKTILIELIQYKENLKNIDIENINEENLIETMDSFYLGYGNVNTLLGLLETTLNNSISSVGSLSDSDIDGYVSKVNSYQNSNQGNLSSFNSTKSSITTFLNTYKQSELSALKSIELKEKQLEDSGLTGETSYNKKITAIDSDLYSFESKKTQAQAEYDNAVANKTVSIKSLDNSIASAKNSRDKYSLEYSKLTVTSPITGIISTVDTDNNSNVSNGTKLFTIISNTKTQINVSLTSNEIRNIVVGDTVKVNYLDKYYYGEVYSKSSVADKNLEFGVTISLKESLELLGGSTIVEFSSTHENILLPLDTITIQGDNLGTINYLIEGKLETIEVTLGNIEGNNVVILSELPAFIEIITTDLSNYNPLNQTLEVNNKK